MRKLRIGIFGGSFDPPHLGHMYLAEVFKEKLNLDIILFVPSGQPYHKRSPLAKASDRFQMVKAATGRRPEFRVSRVDIDRKGPTFTIDTVTELKAQFGKEARLFFMIGADNVKKISTWKNYKSLLRLCKFVAIPRPGSRRGKSHLKGFQTIDIIPCTPLNISSRQIRGEIQSGSEAPQYKLPPRVWSYIKRKGLYV